MLHPGGAGNAAPCCRPTKPIPTRLVVPILLLRRLPLYLGLMKALLPPADKALPTAVLSVCPWQQWRHCVPIPRLKRDCRRLQGPALRAANLLALIHPISSL